MSRQNSLFSKVIFLFIVGVFVIFLYFPSLVPKIVKAVPQNCWKNDEEIINTPSTMANFDWPMCSDVGTSPDNTPAASADPANQFDSGSDPMGQFDNAPITVPLRNQNDPANGNLRGYDCGPTAMGMIADYYHNVLGIDTINNLPTAGLASIAGTSKEGTTMKQLFDLAQAIGFTNTEYSSNPGLIGAPGAIIDVISNGALSYNTLTTEVSGGYPAIVNVDLSPYSNGHALVVTGVSNGNVSVNNPDTGQAQIYGEAEFRAMWGSKSYSYVIPKP